jgi:Ca-activated chloride channel family protein
MALSDEQPMAGGGFTALFEAVRVGLNLLDSAATRRRALLVISDGNEELPGDQWLRGGISGHTVWRRINASARDRLPKYLEVVRRSEGLVYAVGSDPRGPYEPWGEETLKALVDPTGGFVTTVHANADIPSAVERVLNDLRDQYLIGFTPTDPADGKFHKLRVTVRGCDCHARARAGFVHSR